MLKKRNLLLIEKVMPNRARLERVGLSALSLLLLREETCLKNYLFRSSISRIKVLLLFNSSKMVSGDKLLLILFCRMILKANKFCTPTARIRLNFGFL